MKHIKLISQKGFSIIELLIVIIFLSAIAAGVIPLFAKAIATNKASKDKLYAYEAAHAEIESMRSGAFIDVVDHTFYIPGLNIATGNMVVDDEINGSPQSDIVEVTATVSWPKKGGTESIEIITYIAEKGINQ